MPLVRFPAPMKYYVDNQSEFEARGATVAELLDDILARYPALKPHLFDSQGNLRRYFNIFVNGVHVRDLEGMSTPLKEDDKVILMASAAGGGDPGLLPAPSSAGARLLPLRIFILTKSVRYIQ